MPEAAKGPADLKNNRVVVLGLFVDTVEVGQDGDFHRSGPYATVFELSVLVWSTT